MRTGVGDVQDAAHPVTVLRLEASRAEIYLLYHVAVDDGESFLLSAADEKRSVDLDTVNVHAVFVE